MRQGMDQVLSSNGGGSGAITSAGTPSQQKDTKDASTAPKFGEVYQQIQAKYGEKAEKPREIKKTLGKDDFLRIMITQMKNQDPTNPFKAEQMATEIAQFTSVEQLQNVNQNLNKMSTQNKPLEQMAMTNLIGKMVTIDRERFPHTEGQSEALKFNLPKNAASVRVALVSETGESVYEGDLGEQKAGEVNLPWDGKKANSLPAKTGNYMLRIDAKDERGSNIDTNPQARGKIIGVSFEGSEPILLVGDAQHQEKITMRNIIKVELDSSFPQPSQMTQTAQLPQGSKEATSVNSPATTSGLKPVETNQSKGPNLFAFQKGVGSLPIDTPTNGPLAAQQKAPQQQAPQQQALQQQALQQQALQQQHSMNTSPSAPSIRPEIARAIDSYQNNSQEKGFPNGLHEFDEPKNEPLKGGDSK